MTATGVLAGTTSITFTPAGTLTNGAPGALTGTSSLTFTPTGTLTGSGALVGASSITFTCSGSITDAASIPVATKTSGGRARKQKRYVVEIDNKLFDVRSIDEAQQLLTAAVELAEQSAQTEERAPRIKIRTGTGRATNSQVLVRAVNKAQKAVDIAYNKQAERRKIDKEISSLMLSTLEKEAREDEDAIIMLLLM